MNSSELLDQGRIEYSQMSYQLKRLVCSEEDSHLALTQVPLQLEIVPNTLMYFKVSVMNKPAPCKVYI